ncbi:MAG: winged helix-turn-helix domain-containing protein [Actinomycetota bacterium]|nr:winged helix-turn-helix domain-containing protein [Actinomycetota bacterium]
MTRALANATRRQILRSCWSSQRSAGELAAEADLAPASVSEHLKVLRKTGLVVLERAGNHRLYRTDPERVTAVLRALGEDLGPPGSAG